TPHMQAALRAMARTSLYRMRAGWSDGATIHRVGTIGALEDRELCKSDFHGVWLTPEGTRAAAGLA
ncbi:hypothetical protein ACI3PL_31030, partial [Lacticaseibacillus paracasei]